MAVVAVQQQDGVPAGCSTTHTHMVCCCSLCKAGCVCGACLCCLLLVLVHIRHVAVGMAIIREGFVTLGMSLFVYFENISVCIFSPSRI